MYKRFICICVLSCYFAGALLAQVSMTLQVSPTGNIVKNQLWNMLLVNSGNANLMVSVNLTLMDINTNQPVITAVSAPLTLPSGAKQVTSVDLSPIRYVYNMPGSSTDRDPNGLLPAGNYQACYTIQALGKSNFLSENCIQLNISPLSPPLLNTPTNGEMRASLYPQFTWLPPTPAGMIGDLNFDILVVEVLTGQGKADAIQQNVPFYSAGRLRELYAGYPSSARAMDTSKLYAWRIAALNGRQLIAMSDIWTFRVGSLLRKGVQKQASPYVNLNRGQEASIVSGGSILNISYENAAADTVINYSIKNLEQAGNPEIQSGSIVVKYGRNLLEVPLRKNKGFVERSVYQFSFINSRGETWSVKFTWSPF